MPDPLTESRMPPLAVRPLEYSTPMAGRPGIITAIGVISIVVASLSLMNSLGCGAQMFVLTMMSRMTGGGPAPVATVAPLPRPFGMAEESRNLVVDTLAEIEPLAEMQRLHLDALLEEGGARMFAVPAEALTADLVRNNVSRSGERPGGADGPVKFFVIGQGRMDISMSEATFVPTGSGMPVTASWTEAGGGSLDEAAIGAVIMRIEQLAGQQLNEQQIEAMKELLAGSDQELIDVGWPGQVEDQVSSAMLGGAGDIIVYTMEGWAWIQSDGQVQVTSYTFAGFGPGFQVSSLAIATMTVALLANLGLAVYLLVIGIMTLRQHPLGGRLHAIYAWMKIPAAVVGGLAVGWMVHGVFSGMASTMPPAAGGPPAEMIAAGYAVTLAGLGLIYPIALLIALRTRTIREYYASVR
jgi:hypothetical protein